MSWRLAKSLEVLRAEFDTRAPDRNKASDGTIGDENHQGRPSDHNPNADGVVCAMDITHDPAHGLDMDPISDQLVAEPRHPALKYVIFNALIAGTHTNWQWQQNSGHTQHMHVSVGVGEDGQSTGPYDDTSAWGISNGAPPPPPPTGGVKEFRTWGTGINVRAEANTSSAVVTTLSGPTTVKVDFQVHGESVTAEGHTNDGWAHLPELGGFISNIYIDVDEAWLPGVPEGA